MRLNNFWEGFEKQAGLFSALKKGLKAAPTSKGSKSTVSQLKDRMRERPAMPSTKSYKNPSLQGVPVRTKKYIDY